MHMGDALLSPAVGGTMWAASAATIALSSARLRRDADQRLTPLMGVLGAFLFAAQMINFAIPGTGSSGHLAGGILLAALLGPHAAFLSIASVLVVQALFFADGGLLALGCNLFNMGIIPCFAVFPWIFIPLAGTGTGRFRVNAAIMASAVVALQLGAFAVVAETFFSRTASLPFSTFLLLMQPIHLAIGIVEGAATIAILSFIRKSRPDIVRVGDSEKKPRALRLRGACFAILAVALFTGGIVSEHASAAPDGLEWALSRITGKPELPVPDGATHQALGAAQKRSALFPDYHLANPVVAAKAAGERHAAPSVKSGTGTAGIAGTMMTLALSFGCARLLRKKRSSDTVGTP